MEKIAWEGVLLAIVLRGDADSPGVNFVTSSDNPIQLGTLTHPKGARVKPHSHRPIRREIGATHEVIHIERGRVEVQLYGPEGQEADRTVLQEGDTILLMSGGHGFIMLEDSKILEVKQGPYFGAGEDKQFFSQPGAAP